MFLYLTRHGETQWNRLGKTQGTQDIGLNELGYNQAESLANHLKTSNNIAYIYSSDLSRARHTANIIGGKLNLRPSLCSQLREISFGDWEGFSIAEIERQYPGQLKRWRNDIGFAPRNGESLLDVQGRISFFIDMLKTKHIKTDDNVLVVSHAATTKMLILSLMGIPINLLTNFRINQASLSLLKLEQDNTSIIYLNNTHYLPGLPQVTE